MLHLLSSDKELYLGCVYIMYIEVCRKGKYTCNTGLVKRVFGILGSLMYSAYVDPNDCSLQVHLLWSFDGSAISGDMGLLFGGDGPLIGCGCWWRNCSPWAGWLPCRPLLQETSISSVFCNMVRSHGSRSHAERNGWTASLWRQLKLCWAAHRLQRIDHNSQQSLGRPSCPRQRDQYQLSARDGKGQQACLLENCCSTSRLACVDL